MYIRDYSIPHYGKYVISFYVIKIFARKIHRCYKIRNTMEIRIVCPRCTHTQCKKINVIYVCLYNTNLFNLDTHM